MRIESSLHMRERESFDLSNELTLHEVFSRYYQALCFYACRLLSNNDVAAKDIVQEVFVSVWNKKLVFGNIYSLKAYLYSSVYHSCLDAIKTMNIHQRHHRNIRDEHARQPLDEFQFLNDRIEAEVLAEIFRAIEQLPAQCRKVFNLSYLEGLSVEQVAAEMDISVNTVKTQRTRAKKLLKDRLNKLYVILALLFLY